MTHSLAFFIDKATIVFDSQDTPALQFPSVHHTFLREALRKDFSLTGPNGRNWKSNINYEGPLVIHFSRFVPSWRKRGTITPFTEGAHYFATQVTLCLQTTPLTPNLGKPCPCLMELQENAKCAITKAARTQPPSTALSPDACTSSTSPLPFSTACQRKRTLLFDQFGGRDANSNTFAGRTFWASNAQLF